MLNSYKIYFLQPTAPHKPAHGHWPPTETQAEVASINLTCTGMRDNTVGIDPEGGDTHPDKVCNTHSSSSLYVIVVSIIIQKVLGAVILHHYTFYVYMYVAAEYGFANSIV